MEWSVLYFTRAQEHKYIISFNYYYISNVRLLFNNSLNKPYNILYWKAERRTGYAV